MNTRTLAATVIAIALLGPAAAEPGDVAAKVSDDAIELSPYEIRANRAAFKGWIKVASPNYTLYTDTTPDEAMTLLQQMEMLRLTTQELFDRRARSNSPVLVVVPIDTSDWSRIGRPELPSGKKAGRRITRLCLTTQDWKKDGLDVLWAVLSITTLDALNIDATFWFRQGTALYFETAIFSADTLKIGTSNSRTSWTYSEGVIPWPRFFAFTGEAPGDLPGTARGYLGQSAAFVQFALGNQDPAWTPRMLVWNALMRAGREPSEELFHEVFGQGWAEWSKTMMRHMGSGAYNVYTLRIPESVRNTPRIQQPVGATEMRELFILAQILNQETLESEKSLDTMLARGLKTEHLRDLLAEACASSGREEAMITQLRQIITRGSSNPDVFATAAETIFRRAVPALSINARLDAETVDQLRTWCRRAIELEPYHARAFTQLAWVEALAPQVDATSVETVANLCRHMDGHGTTDQLITALAIVRWRAGLADSARLAGQVLVDSPFSSNTCRDLARAVLAALDTGSAAAP